VSGVAAIIGKSVCVKQVPLTELELSSFKQVLGLYQNFSFSQKGETPEQPALLRPTQLPYMQGDFETQESPNQPQMQTSSHFQHFK